MKQILQSIKTGVTEVAEVPIPRVMHGSLLIKTSKTLVSAGTERMLIEFGNASWLGKARQQPDKIKMVLDKIRTDGLHPTIEAVLNKLDKPLPLGYCNVGHVLAAEGVNGFKLGQRVVSNGSHAEVVSVPFNLCAAVPDAVSDEAAAFTVLGAIALQGIRLVKPTLGETVVVIGLGLIGLMTVQLLRANGCRVLGVDFSAERLALAQHFGAEIINLAASSDPVDAAIAYSRGRGVDAVIITTATNSNEPVRQAAQMCRKRGRIVLVGVAGLEISRTDFYQKELTFQVSCSYGPGRYDSDYEVKGFDYPVGFVRWTEQRNFEAVLDMLADGRLDVQPLISHRFLIEEAQKAYSLIGGDSPSLGILLSYPAIEITDASKTISLFDVESKTTNSYSDDDQIIPAVRDSCSANDVFQKNKVSFIGSGNYATSVLIPAFKTAGACLKSVASSGGVSGVHAGRKFGFAETTTDSDRLFNDTETDAIVITTRHNSHAPLVLQGLKAGKHVFVEKPLCLSLVELADIQVAYRPDKILFVGFNRRFAPQVLKIKDLLRLVSGPKAFLMTVNSGLIPFDHWTQDQDVGGGRIIGEACHFIDLLRYLAGSSITKSSQNIMTSSTGDTVTLNLEFGDGSIGTIHYFANGSKSFPKERLEVFAAGGVLQLDNYRKLTGFGWPGFKKMNLWRQDKGHHGCVVAFLDALRTGASAPIPIEEIFEVSRISIELAKR